MFNAPEVRPLAAAVALASTLSASNNAFAQLEEVIVTAQKRLESAQDVPIAVTAFDAPRPTLPATISRFAASAPYWWRPRQTRG